MLVECGAVADGPGAEVFVSCGGAVGVAAFQDEGSEPPGMVMVCAGVVLGEPVVDADGADFADVDAPADDVGAFGEAKWFPPWGGREPTYPPLYPRGALDALSYPGMMSYLQCTTAV